MAAIAAAELVERIWARDPTVWTAGDEASWLGWLDEPGRMRAELDELRAFAADVRGGDFDHAVLLGMGGSSLAPEVLRRAFKPDWFTVLDTTHPAAIRALGESLDLERSLFIVSSKSGTTLETLSHLDYFWEKTRRRGPQFVAVTDPGSSLESRARERGFRAIFSGEPTIGGRYSALSPFGLVPAAMIGVDLDRMLELAEEMAAACRGGDANPGLELGLRLGEGWREGRDKVCIDDTPEGFGLWAEQLVAESTGKEGKGLVPAPGESPEGPDRQAAEVRLASPNELGAEFFRWEFAVAVAGSILEINPFDQPNVQEAKDRTTALLSSDTAGAWHRTGPEGSVQELFGQARDGDYVAIQAFIDAAQAWRLDALVERARSETGCVVTVGLGPRYLHSTGQLHKGGPPTVLALQVVDDPGEELPIPGRDFGFARLIQAQAAGDYLALKERGRRVARVRLEDL